MSIRTSWGGAWLALQVAALWACSPEPELPRGPLSVVLITIDTLRADHLNAYGYDVPTSPSLASLAERGLLFERAYAPTSFTAPSITSMMTGLYPSFHSVGLTNGGTRLVERTVTLAERARDTGIRTAAIISNPTLDRKLGLDQGFDHYDDRTQDDRVSWPKLLDADQVVDRAIAQLGESAGAPFFVWLHLMDPHGPYRPGIIADQPGVIPERWELFRGRAYPHPTLELPLGSDQSGHGAIPEYQDYRGEARFAQYVRRYDCEIALLDRELQRLIDAIDASSGAGKTLVILTADHGEAFGEDDFYFAHGHSVGIDQVHVPLLILGPGVRPGQRFTAPVSTSWIFDTVVAIWTSSESDRDLLRIALSRRVTEPVFSETGNQVAIARDGVFLRRDRRSADDLEFWSHGNPATGFGFWKPLGEELVASASPDSSIVESLRARLAEYDATANEARAAFNAPPITPSEQRLEQLRALGYAQ